jgi:hypothetical protein
MSPDGSAKPPPEEKLLRLIRGKPARPALSAAGMRQPGSLMSASTQTAGALVAHPSSRRPSWPVIAAWSLGGLLVLETGLLIAQALRPLPPVRLPVEAALEQPPAPVAPPEMPSVSASASRTLFAPPAAAAVGGSGVPAAGMSASAKSLASRLTLMGIVAGDTPQAIIEDGETKKTFFVTKGQMVVDGATVDQVLDNRVVLDVGGQKIDLSL